MKKTAVGVKPRISGTISKSGNSGAPKSHNDDNNCVFCGKSVVNSAFLVFAMNNVQRKTHNDCLQCSQCKTKLEKEAVMMSEKGELLCRADFEAKYAKTCHACNNIIDVSERFVSVENKKTKPISIVYFHESHFVCSMCGLSLIGKPHYYHHNESSNSNRNSGMFCEGCFLSNDGGSQKCAICGVGMLAWHTLPIAPEFHMCAKHTTEYYPCFACGGISGVRKLPNMANAIEKTKSDDVFWSKTRSLEDGRFLCGFCGQFAVSQQEDIDAVFKSIVLFFADMGLLTSSFHNSNSTHLLEVYNAIVVKQVQSSEIHRIIKASNREQGHGDIVMGVTVNTHEKKIITRAMKQTIPSPMTERITTMTSAMVMVKSAKCATRPSKLTLSSSTHSNSNNHNGNIETRTVRETRIDESGKKTIVTTTTTINKATNKKITTNTTTTSSDRNTASTSSSLHHQQNNEIDNNKESNLNTQSNKEKDNQSNKEKNTQSNKEKDNQSNKEKDKQSDNQRESAGRHIEDIAKQAVGGLSHSLPIHLNNNNNDDSNDPKRKGKVVKTESQSVLIGKFDNRAVEYIAVLSDLPIVNLIATLAHELGHAFVNLARLPFLPKDEEEGICECFAATALENIRSLHTCGFAKEEVERMAGFLLTAMGNRKDRVYGEGYKKCLRVMRREGGLLGLLRSVKNNRTVR